MGRHGAVWGLVEALCHGLAAAVVTHGLLISAAANQACRTLRHVGKRCFFRSYVGEAGGTLDAYRFLGFAEAWP
jgi:hypothetical protein